MKRFSEQPWGNTVVGYNCGVANSGWLVVWLVLGQSTDSPQVNTVEPRNLKPRNVWHSRGLAGWLAGSVDSTHDHDITQLISPDFFYVTPRGK